MATVPIDGNALHVECFGERGPNLVVAHGLMGSVALTSRFGERLEDLAARGLRVVAYDARGHGLSPGPRAPEAYRWARHARDLGDLIEAMGLGPASICGGSMGAGAAILLALERPHLVDRIILRSPPPFGDDLAAARRLLLPLATLYSWIGSEWTARLVTALPPVKRMQRDTPANDLRSYFAMQRRETVVPAIRGLLSEREPISPDTFARIPHETLVLAHPGDAIHPMRSAELLCQRIPRAKLVTAPSAAYYAENPGRLSEIIADFLLTDSGPTR